jgi:hypothetical protein
MLLGNGFCRSGGIQSKQFGGTAISGTAPSNVEGRWQHAGTRRNQLAGNGITDSKASVPNGARHPVAWLMARKNGGMASSTEARITFTPTAAGTMGFPITGTTTFTISTNTPDGQLISSATGTASMAITGTGNVLATLSTTGTASITLTTNTPLLKAIKWLDATAGMSITATMTSYGKGFMVGSTADGSSIVNANIVSVNGYSVKGNGQTGSEWGPV